MRLLGINDLDLLQALFDKLERSPFFVKDAGLRYRAANQAMARLCGVGSCQEMIGKTAAEFYPLSDATRYEAVESAVLQSGQPSATMLDYIPGSDPTWLVFSYHALLDDRARPVGVAGSSIRLDRRDFQDRIYRRVLSASEWLHANPAAALDVRRLAEKAGTSVAQLQRDFQKVFRMPLRRFLAQSRLLEARRLLLADRSIGDVAHDVGFADHSAFSRRFHAEFGMTPRAFKRLYAGQRGG